LKWSQKEILKGKFHNTRSEAKPRTRWEDVVHMDALQIRGIQGWRNRAGGAVEWGGGVPFEGSEGIVGSIAPYMEVQDVK
jgi:hypothetical protein